MEIERGGHTVATVKKALISPLRERFSIEVEGGEDMEAKGNIVDHEYKIERGGDKVAEVSKRWFRVRDTYGIEVAPGPGRRADPRRRRLHRPDGARLNSETTASHRTPAAGTPGAGGRRGGDRCADVNSARRFRLR